MFEIPGEVYDSDADEKDPINPADLLSNDDNDVEETTVLEVEPIIEVANIKEENIEAENIVEELEEDPPPETKPTLSIKPITRSGHYFKEIMLAFQKNLNKKVCIYISVANIQNPFPLHLVKLRNRALKFLVLISLVCQAKYPKAHEK